MKIESSLADIGMPFNFNLFGVITGMLGLFGVFQFVSYLILSCLPSHKLSLLERVFDDIDRLLQLTVEGGIVYDATSVVSPSGAALLK